MSETIPVKQLSSEPRQAPINIGGGKVYTRRISGFYQRLRRNVAMPLLLAYFLFPWLNIEDRPAVLLDLTAQKFHIFWMTFWPQDGLLLAWLLIISALALFVVTVWVGRVWCGFSCPQTIWTQMFIWIEDKCEGDRLNRIKLDAAAWSTKKLLRKISKHLLWGLLAFFTSFTFVGYFYNVHEFIRDLLHLTVGLDALFWLGFFALATYLNAGWMREQVCKHMCPYARFQSVMYDNQTKAVAYDATRGDSFIDASTGTTLNKNTLGNTSNTDNIVMQRLPRSAKVDHKAAGMGDCIDCSWCVQVCPVDIDIREGIQADCINCGLCVDACDSIMDKMNYPRGLIRFASEDELEGQGNDSKARDKDNEVKNSHVDSHSDGDKINVKINTRLPINTRLRNPRLIGYGLMLLIVTGLFVTQLVGRTPLDVGIIRDRGINLYRERNGNIENVYLLRLSNMSREAQHYQISVLPPYTLKGRRKILLEEGEVLSLPLRAVLKASEVKQAQQEIVFQVRSLTDSTISVDKVASFISPPSH